MSAINEPQIVPHSIIIPEKQFASSLNGRKVIPILEKAIREKYQNIFYRPLHENLCLCRCPTYLNTLTNPRTNPELFFSSRCISCSNCAIPPLSTVLCGTITGLFVKFCIPFSVCWTATSATVGLIPTGFCCGLTTLYACRLDANIFKYLPFVENLAARTERKRAEKIQAYLDELREDPDLPIQLDIFGDLIDETKPSKNILMEIIEQMNIYQVYLLYKIFEEKGYGELILDASTGYIRSMMQFLNNPPTDKIRFEAILRRKSRHFRNFPALLECLREKLINQSDECLRVIDEFDFNYYEQNAFQSNGDIIPTEIKTNKVEQRCCSIEFGDIRLEVDIVSLKKSPYFTVLFSNGFKKRLTKVSENHYVLKIDTPDDPEAFCTIIDWMNGHEIEEIDVSKMQWYHRLLTSSNYFLIHEFSLQLTKKILKKYPETPFDIGILTSIVDNFISTDSECQETIQLHHTIQPILQKILSDSKTEELIKFMQLALKRVELFPSFIWYEELLTKKNHFTNQEIQIILLIPIDSLLERVGKSVAVNFRIPEKMASYLESWKAHPQILEWLEIIINENNLICSSNFKYLWQFQECHHRARLKELLILYASQPQNQDQIDSLWSLDEDVPDEILQCLLR